VLAEDAHWCRYIVHDNRPSHPEYKELPTAPSGDETSVRRYRPASHLLNR
jgi:hypothetical protein